MKLTRRKALVLLGGGATALGTGTIFVATMSDEDLVHLVLERHLGPINMAKEDLAAFLSNFRQARPWLFPPTKLAIAYGTAERLGLDKTLRNHLPGSRGTNLDQFERHLLGSFHIQTDVGLRSSPDDPVVYLGDGACLNPFATFA